MGIISTSHSARQGSFLQAKSRTNGRSRPLAPARSLARFVQPHAAHATGPDRAHALSQFVRNADLAEVWLLEGEHKALRVRSPVACDSLQPISKLPPAVDPI